MVKVKDLDLNRWQYRRLKMFFIDENATHTEGVFYHYPHNEKYLIKMYLTKNEELLRKKCNQVSSIIDNKDEIKIPELILPESLVFVKDEFKGIVIPKVDGFNLSIVLNGYFPLSHKIDYLKQVGQILKKIEEVDNRFNLAFSDVWPDNFMITNDKVVGIDTDSINIFNYLGRTNDYLQRNPWIKSLEKYPCEGNIIKASSNTDIFAYIMIILNTISKVPIYRLTLDMYKKYLDFLDHIGVNNSLLEAFESICIDKKDNINPLIALDTLKEFDNQEIVLSLRRKDGK